MLPDAAGDYRVLGFPFHPDEEACEYYAHLGEGQALVAEQLELVVDQLGVAHDRRYREKGEDHPGHVADELAGHVRKVPVGDGPGDEDDERADDDHGLPALDLHGEEVPDGGAEQGSQAERQRHHLVGVQPLALRQLTHEPQCDGEKEPCATSLDYAEGDHHLHGLGHAQADRASEEQRGADDDIVLRTEPVHKGSGDDDDGDFSDDVRGEQPAGDVGAGLDHDVVVRYAHVHPVEAAHEHAKAQGGGSCKVALLPHRQLLCWLLYFIDADAG